MTYAPRLERSEAVNLPLAFTVIGARPGVWVRV